ncbi:hypothetical protein HMPREF9570_01690 [Cutibacterium acnes HL043PA1]|nr:hypothetical protein HMPREF9570_01690 [Cutibacterium acnes HL043PA1]
MQKGRWRSSPALRYVRYLSLTRARGCALSGRVASPQPRTSPHPYTSPRLSRRVWQSG